MLPFFVVLLFCLLNGKSFLSLLHIVEIILKSNEHFQILWHYVVGLLVAPWMTPPPGGPDRIAFMERAIVRNARLLPHWSAHPSLISPSARGRYVVIVAPPPKAFSLAEEDSCTSLWSGGGKSPFMAALIFPVIKDPYPCPEGYRFWILGLTKYARARSLTRPASAVLDADSPHTSPVKLSLLESKIGKEFRYVAQNFLWSKAWPGEANQHKLWMAASGQNKMLSTPRVSAEGAKHLCLPVKRDLLLREAAECSCTQPSFWSSKWGVQSMGKRSFGLNR